MNINCEVKYKNLLDICESAVPCFKSTLPTLPVYHSTVPKTMSTNNALKASISALQTTVNNEMKNMKSKFDDVFDQMNQIVDRLERVEEKTEINLNEIRELKMNLNENTVLLTHEKIDKDSATLRDDVRLLLKNELDMPDVVVELSTIRRFGSASRVIIKLPSHDAKMRIFSAKKRYKNLHPNSTIYVSEFLSKYNSQLLTAARKLKFDKKIHSAYSFNGRIFIRKTQTDDAIEIKDLTQLVNTTDS